MRPPLISELTLLINKGACNIGEGIIKGIGGIGEGIGKLGEKLR